MSTARLLASAAGTGVACGLLAAREGLLLGLLLLTVAAVALIARARAR